MNIITKKYIKEKIKNVKLYAKLKFKSNSQALKLSTKRLDKRLDDANRFREQLREQQQAFLPKNEFIIQHTKLENQMDELKEDIKILRESKANLEGKASMASVYLSYVIASIALILTILRFFIH